jgi:hypothetical protein
MSKRPSEQPMLQALQMGKILYLIHNQEIVKLVHTLWFRLVWPIDET